MVRALVLSREDISPAGRPLRGRSRSFTLVTLLAALYLIVALSVPGAFLIAKQASVVVSSSQPILPLEHSSSEQFGGNAGEDGGEHSWHGPKRLRGALLLPKVGIDKIVKLLITSLAGPTTLLEHAESHKPVVADEVQLPQDDAFPQELLGRSPPSSR
jgi:hypothetical protein